MSKQPATTNPHKMTDDELLDALGCPTMSHAALLGMPCSCKSGVDGRCQRCQGLDYLRLLGTPFVPPLKPFADVLMEYEQGGGI